MKTELIKNLKVSLNNIALPGTDAHDKMRPKRISGPHTDFNKDLDKYTKASILIALYHEHNSLVFPLIERTYDNSIHSGQIAFPGGKMENGESDVECAKREANEELGISTTDIDIIGKLSLTPIPPSQYLVTPIIGILKNSPQYYPCNKEVNDFFTVDIDELFKSANFKCITKPHRQAIYQIPYIELANKIVWGATAMILYELKMIFESS